MIVTSTYRQAKSKWIAVYVVFLLMLAVAIFVGGGIQQLDKIWMMGLPLIIGTYLWQKAKPNRTDLLNYIHQHIPISEYSLDLIDKRPAALSVLEKIQVDKIQYELSKEKIDLPFDRRLIGQLGILAIIAIIGSAVSVYLPKSDGGEKVVVEKEEIIPIIMQREVDSIALLNNRITITPPSYTRSGMSRQQELDLSILEGSKVGWKISWTGKEEAAALILEDEEIINIKNNQFYNKPIFNNSFYRYKIEGSSNSIESPYGAVKVQLDEAANVTIKDIEEYQRLDYKQNYNIEFGISIDDEYGIEEAHIIATIAKGQGESVKFREKKFDLINFANGSRKYDGSYTFRTKELSMEPGDELYFHIAAKDNCPYREQWSKSPTYFVMLEDTSTYFYTEDAGMQVDLMPDFFRSQRQIIIDSEKLLAEQETISEEDFNRRSNELGFDQRQLRLKYGQFLGEESESGIAIENEIELEEDDHEGHDHEGHEHHDHEGHDHDHHESDVAAPSKDVISDFMHDHDHGEEHGGNLLSQGAESEDPTRPSWVAELSHNHDNMEEATFHQMATKNKLRAAMSEMWDAELHLRLYDPKMSLPYQNRSLKLLQEIKNHARIYVHRIGFDPPAIKENERRLSGDQDEIISPLVELSHATDDAAELFKTAYRQISDNQLSGDLGDLEVATSAIAERALKEPSLLPLLTDMQLLLSGQRETKLIRRLQQGLAALLESDVSEPTAVQVFNHPITASTISELTKAQ